MNKKLIYSLFFVLCMMVIGFYVYVGNGISGNVIILNGPSGSGKSSIQKEFQKIMMPDLWIKVGVDNLFDSPMPDINSENLGFWQSKNSIRWVEELHDEVGNKVIKLFVGKQGESVVYGMNSAIAAYAKSGCSVIVDYIAYDQQWFKDLEMKCSKCKTYYVAVDIPLDVLEQREEARGTSPKGHARSHYFDVYGDKKYDLRVNSGHSTAAEIAQELRQLIKD